MSLYAYAMLLLLFILGAAIPQMASEEIYTINRWDAAESTQLDIYAYSNYVRDVLRDAQNNNAIPAGNLCYVEVLGHIQANSGPAIIPTGAVKQLHFHKSSINKYGLGNVLALDDTGKYWLYSWSLPPKGNVEAEVKRSFSRDAASRYYVKHGDRLVCASSPEESRTIAGGAEAAIPNGAIVVISQPVEHGPTDFELNLTEDENKEAQNGAGFE